MATLGMMVTLMYGFEWWGAECLGNKSLLVAQERPKMIFLWHWRTYVDIDLFKDVKSNKSQNGLFQS